MTFKKLDPANNRSLGADPSLVQPSNETPAPADTLTVIL